MSLPVETSLNINKHCIYICYEYNKIIQHKMRLMLRMWCIHIRVTVTSKKTKNSLIYTNSTCK